MTKQLLKDDELAAINRLRNPALKVLLGAYYLLSSKARWTKSTYARDSNGLEVASHSADAVCFCSLGAIDRAQEELGSVMYGAQPAKFALDRALPRMGIFLASVARFNDSKTTSFKDVKTVFAEAIKRESRGRIVLKELS